MTDGSLSTPDGEKITTAGPWDFASAWAGVQLPVRAFLNSFLGDRSAVDDCLQEVAILAWKKADPSASPDAFRGFCLACARRIAWNEMRKKRRTHLRLLSPTLLGSLADAVAHLEQQETLAPVARISALQECMESLPEEQRYWLDLRYIPDAGMTLQDAAKSRGTNLDAVYKKLERIRAALRSCVERKTPGHR